MAATRPESPGPARADAAVSDFLQIMTVAPRIDLDPLGPTVSVIIPTRNEAKNLSWLARHMPANVHELILVDGRSTDGTVETARSLWHDVRVVEQTRRGKGNALACGFHAATGDIIVMIDADGSMDPGEIPYFVRALRHGADYAKGSRFATGGGSSDITALRAWGNRQLNNVTALLHGTMYSDLCYGFNAFWTTVLPVLDLDPGVAGEDPDGRRWGDGFEVETLINIRVHKAGLKIAEVPSFEAERLHGLSNLNTFRDGLRVLRTIALEKLGKRDGTRLLAGAGYRPAIEVGPVDGAHGVGAFAELEPAVRGSGVETLLQAVGPHEAIDSGIHLVDGAGSASDRASDIVGIELDQAERELDGLRAAS